MRVIRVVGRFTDDRIHAPTPCDAMSVALLQGHLHGVTITFHDAVWLIDGPTTSTPPGTSTSAPTAAWSEKAPDRLAELCIARGRPEACQRSTAAGGQAVSAEEADLIALDGVVLRGWGLGVHQWCVSNKRNGTTTLFAALDVATGQVIGSCLPNRSW